MDIILLPALQDNYIWILQHQQNVLVVDPTDAAVVEDFLQQNNLTLSAILITHHHWDHIGGLAELYQRHRPIVYAPQHPDITVAVKNTNQLTSLQWQGLTIAVIQTPGHTLTHCCYFIAQVDSSNYGSIPVLFSGDTLFAAGCGRVFEGTAEQMLTSLQQLKALPAETLLCCGHDYSLSNLKFAQAVEPGNQYIEQRIEECLALQRQGKPCIPTQLWQELLSNPFLRTQQPMVQQAVAEKLPDSSDEVAIFAALRQWKNNY